MTACAVQGYALLLRLCPRSFREEYGADATQVFRQLWRDAWNAGGLHEALALAFAALGDLLAGALADYFALGVGVWNRSWVMNRMRSSAILVFCAYILYVVVGLGFQKSTEEVVKSNLLTTYSGIGLAYQGVIVGAVIALLATLAGGLPIAFAALRQAFARRRWGIVALFAVPPVALAIWLGWTFTLLDVIFPGNKATNGVGPASHPYIYSWIAVFIVAAIASVAAVAVAIARSELQPGLFRFALAPEIGVALGMLVTVVSIVALNVQLQTYAPNYLSGSDGPPGLQAPMGAHLIADIVVMSLAMLVVIAGIVRGSAARRAGGAGGVQAA